MKSGQNLGGTLVTTPYRRDADLANTSLGSSAHILKGIGLCSLGILVALYIVGAVTRTSGQRSFASRNASSGWVKAIAS